MILRSELTTIDCQLAICCRVLEGAHASFLESVPFKIIAAFTIFQLVYFLMIFGVTWIPIAGILFPLPFFALIWIRKHILPKFFPPEYLQELDSAEYEESTGVPIHSMTSLTRVFFYLVSLFYRTLYSTAVRFCMNSKCLLTNIIFYCGSYSYSDALMLSNAYQICGHE